MDALKKTVRGNAPHVQKSKCHPSFLHPWPAKHEPTAASGRAILATAKARRPFLQKRRQSFPVVLAVEKGERSA